VLTALILFIFVLKGVVPGAFTGYLLPITYLAVLATLVESLPIKDMDNITVTLAAVALGYLLFY
jgi:dolichol kinase